MSLWLRLRKRIRGGKGKSKQNACASQGAEKLAAFTDELQEKRTSFAERKGSSVSGARCLARSENGWETHLYSPTTSNSEEFYKAWDHGLSSVLLNLDSSISDVSVASHSFSKLEKVVRDTEARVSEEGPIHVDNARVTSEEVVECRDDQPANATKIGMPGLPVKAVRLSKRRRGLAMRMRKQGWNYASNSAVALLTNMADLKGLLAAAFAFIAVIRRWRMGNFYFKLLFSAIAKYVLGPLQSARATKRLGLGSGLSKTRKDLWNTFSETSIIQPSSEIVHGQNVPVVSMESSPVQSFTPSHVVMPSSISELNLKPVTPRTESLSRTSSLESDSSTRSGRMLGLKFNSKLLRSLSSTKVAPGDSPSFASASLLSQDGNKYFACSSAGSEYSESDAGSSVPPCSNLKPVTPKTESLARPSSRGSDSSTHSGRRLGLKFKSKLLRSLSSPKVAHGDGPSVASASILSQDSNKYFTRSSAGSEHSDSDTASSLPSCSNSFRQQSSKPSRKSGEGTRQKLDRKPRVLGSSKRRSRRYTSLVSKSTNDSNLGLASTSQTEEKKEVTRGKGRETLPAVSLLVALVFLTVGCIPAVLATTSCFLLLSQLHKSRAGRGPARDKDANRRAMKSSRKLKRESIPPSTHAKAEAFSIENRNRVIMRGLLDRSRRSSS